MNTEGPCSQAVNKRGQIPVEPVSAYTSSQVASESAAQQQGKTQEQNAGQVPPYNQTQQQAPRNSQQEQAQGSYVPPSYGNTSSKTYQAQYVEPITTPKDHVAAGLLAIFLGGLGIHKFYLGYTNVGFIMLAITIVGGIFTLGIASGVIEIIALIEGIIYLTKSQSEFEQIYVLHKKEWF